ncbi:hypothetical protein DSO57_1038667 [Entomophthora muscae]|uniref:Uncharacterized protein n=1 Tax=Entomophthora muscae TaxID=34485 RepID=A0ACC2RPL3_9FUNG|nr:hypothetical protein DSO57_1038667 [Entomophthora muscae]
METCLWRCGPYCCRQTGPWGAFCPNCPDQCWHSIKDIVQGSGLLVQFGRPSVGGRSLSSPVSVVQRELGSSVCDDFLRCSVLHEDAVVEVLVCFCCCAIGGGCVSIDNFPPLEPQAQEQGSNPEPGSPWAARPVDCGTAHPRFPGIKPLQADTKHIDQCGIKSQTKRIITPNGGVITASNGGNKISAISFISLKFTLVIDQEPSPEGGIGLRPNLMTTTLEQDNQVVNSRSLINDRTPGPGAILLPLNQSAQNHQACLSQCPNEPPSDSCPPGPSFGPVNFTEYPLKPEYKAYTPEKIFEPDSLACIQYAVRYNHQGPWIFSTPKFFREKFNYPPAYNLHIKPPVTPKPMPSSLPDLLTDHTGKLFGIVYIILTGVIDTIILDAGWWSWAGKSFSYLFKLAPLL